MKSLRCLLLSFSILSVSIGAPGHAQEGVHEVKIGFAGPLSEVRVRAALDAARLAAEQANTHAPQIGGRKVSFQILSQDDKGDARTAPLVAQYLIHSSVVGVIGHWTSTCSIAAAPVYHQAGMTHVSPASTSHKLTQLGFQTTFRIMGHDDAGGAFLGTYVVNELKARRIMVIDDGSQFGIGLADQFSATVTANKGNIVNRSNVSSKTSDFNSVLRIAKDSNADLIFLSVRVNQSGEFARSMKRLGVSATLLASGGTVSPTFLAMAGDAADGTMAMEPGPALEQLPAWKKLQKEFAAAGITEDGPFTVFAYDATSALIAAILQANSLEPDAITAAMRKLQYKGVTGNIAFDAEGNLRQPVYTLYRVQKGAWVPFKTFGGK
ncbi:branched-chain amino acid ABC transporter substrate-binding protein [Herbaspirillum chlorophenolicum]|uniref:Branched-chain amino acid ABC transporter substrate-binding protein n=1 Tax=Herbaspirillum chlorophenolicum TaxID=211589 RepID=A0ABW8EVV6_9BURK